MKKRSLIITCLTILMMGSALQAMDPGYAYSADAKAMADRPGNINSEPGILSMRRTPGAVVEMMEMDDEMQERQFDLDKQLIEATKHRNKQQIEQLLADGADVNASPYGSTALMYAAAQGNKEVCELLIAHGANLNARNYRDRETALMSAASLGHEEVCKLLTQNGANLYIVNRRGETALVGASLLGEKEICKLLINAMIKPTEDQVQCVVALLGIAKKRQIGALNSVPRDVVKLIGREQYNDLKRENKPNAEVEINRIPDEKMKQELLDYLNKI